MLMANQNRRPPSYKVPRAFRSGPKKQCEGGGWGGGEMASFSERDLVVKVTVE